MTVATMTSKGQITVPKEVRDALGLKAGTRVSFILDDAGNCVLKAKTGSVRDLAGLLTHEGPGVSIDDMETAIAEGAAATMRASQ